MSPRSERLSPERRQARKQIKMALIRELQRQAREGYPSMLAPGQTVHPMVILPVESGIPRTALSGGFDLDAIVDAVVTAVGR